MYNLLKVIPSFLLLALTLPVLAQSCPYSTDEECVPGQTHCAANDYLGVSEAELAILGKESYHANIAMIEKALKERGVKLPERGMVTSEFRSALIAFQESAGLPSTGEINQPTLDKLGVKL